MLMPSFAAVQRVAAATGVPSVMPQRRWTWARQSLGIYFIFVLVGVIATGVWIGNQIESSVLDRTASVTALYVDSLISPRLKDLPTAHWLSTAQVADLDHLVNDTALGQGVAAFKVWSPDRKILYSLDKSIIGQQYPTSEEFET